MSWKRNDLTIEIPGDFNSIIKDLDYKYIYNIKKINTYKWVGIVSKKRNAEKRH